MQPTEFDCIEQLVPLHLIYECQKKRNELESLFLLIKNVETGLNNLFNDTSSICTSRSPIINSNECEFISKFSIVESMLNEISRDRKEPLGLLELEFLSQPCKDSFEYELFILSDRIQKCRDRLDEQSALLNFSQSKSQRVQLPQDETSVERISEQIKANQELETKETILSLENQGNLMQPSPSSFLERHNRNALSSNHSYSSFTLTNGAGGVGLYKRLTESLLLSNDNMEFPSLQPSLSQVLFSSRPSSVSSSILSSIMNNIDEAHERSSNELCAQKDIKKDDMAQEDKQTKYVSPMRRLLPPLSTSSTSVLQKSSNQIKNPKLNNDVISNGIIHALSNSLLCSTSSNSTSSIIQHGVQDASRKQPFSSSSIIKQIQIPKAQNDNNLNKSCNHNTMIANQSIAIPVAPKDTCFHQIMTSNASTDLNSSQSFSTSASSISSSSKAIVTTHGREFEGNTILSGRRIRVAAKNKDIIPHELL